MKRKTVYATALGLAILTAAITSQGAPWRADLLGQPAPVTAAQRTIVITPDTRSVRIEGGEVVKFVIGNRAFAWNFNGPTAVEVLALQRIAPAGALDHDVTAYIDPDPRYGPN
jgi:hypothetical protein